MKRILVVLLLLLVVGGVGAWWWEGRSGPPRVQINQPGAVIGRNGTVDVFVDAPGGRLSKLDVIVEQGGKQTSLYTLQQPGSATLKPGAVVSEGDQLCLVGATGDATGPHLHFELWPAGWREVKGTRPIDPLPQLQRWATG